MTLYNKLVRDKIPEIIRQQGGEPLIRVLSDEDYARCLAQKLDEEVAEFHRDQNLEELADLLEVIYAAAQARGYTLDELEMARKEKVEKRGSFDKKIFLKCFVKVKRDWENNAGLLDSLGFSAE